MRPIDIAPADLETVRCILREHAPGLEVRAFGSRVSFKARETSDLDLALLTEEPLSIARMTNLKAAFTKSYLPFRVDIVDWASASENFQKVIEREHVVLVERNSASKFRASKTKHLGDCVTINDSTYSPKEEYPFINYLDTGNITSNRISEIQFLHVGSDVVPSRARRKVQPGDIVYSTIRPIQRHYGLLKEVPENFLVSTGFCVIRGNPRIAETDFIYWFLTQNSVIEQLNTIAEQSTSAYPSIKPTDIEKLGIELPPLTEQRAIAHILGTLDDKIELNRRMNKTLEEMAQALFKSWFVDFAPVRSKMEGSDTGLPQHFSDLFPDRLVDSEIGEIPDGWDVGCLADIASSPRRSFDPADICGGTPYIGLRHMPRHSIALIEWEGSEKVTSNKFAFKKGEFLFGKLRPYFHKVGLAPVSGICSTDIVVISPNSITWSTFVLATISSIDFISYTNQTSTGTKMPRTSWKTMNRYALCLPPEPVVQLLQNVTEPMLYRIVTNIHHNRNLAALRDILLPKLVSGMLRVEDAAKIVATI